MNIELDNRDLVYLCTRDLSEIINSLKNVGFHVSISNDDAISRLQGALEGISKLIRRAESIITEEA